MTAMEIDCKQSEVSGVSWFEFLLDESLLERHLKSSGDSTATELIAVFLYQVNIATSTAKEILNKEVATGSNGSAETANGANENRSGNGGLIENKKIKLLKLLALKVACHLRWNLDILAASLPLAIQQTLLWELMSVVSSSNQSSVTSSIDLVTADHAEIDLSSLSPDQLFAVLTYHQWCLSTKVQESFPRKPPKTSNIQVPGLLDPNAMFANVKEVILKMLRENADKSVSLLERYLSWSNTEHSTALRMPTISCFGKVADDSNELNHDWSNGLTIESAEITAKVLFTVGTVYFSQYDFKKAYDSFDRCRNALNQIQTAVLGSLDRSRLDGYIVACSSLVPSAQQELTLSSSLYTRVLASVRNNFKDLTALLIEDIVKQELSTTYRASLEEKTHSAARSDSLYEEVLVCNSLRCCLRASADVYVLVNALNRTVGLSDFFIKVCLSIHKAIPSDRRENLKILLRHLSFSLRPNEDFIRKILHSDLVSLFTVDEKSALFKIVTKNQTSANIDLTLNYPKPDENVKLAEMERELLTTYDVQTIRNIVQEVVDKIGNLQTIFLSDTWRIPFELHKLVEGLPLPQPFLPAFVHVLIAKSHICIKLQHYDRARELLLAADETVRDVSYKLSKLLRWELLAADLQQYTDTGSVSAESSVQELVKKSKSCIVSLTIEQDIQPSMDITCTVVVFLLNCSEFEYLASVNDVMNNGYLQFGQIVSTLCKELPMINKARSAARTFIDSVQLSFRPNTELKRTALPGMTMAGGPAPQPGNNEILSQDLLAGFVCKLKVPMALSVFISCFTKLLALARDDISEEIFSDYTTLWPTTLAVNKLDEVAISEMVGSLMHHALSVDPLNPSWLRTHADLHYVQSQFWLALKYYLHVGVVSTDFFSEPITKNVYDDQVYKRMIRCCTNLGCHTQAAVLCQMYDETDYTVAFKSLQERITNDSMDTYYEFIWDTTLLEYIINLHARKGEVTKRQYAMQLIGQLELNSSNRSEILQEAARVRKARFFRALARQYMGVELLTK